MAIMRGLTSTSIRTRLLAAYIGIILIGFTGLTYIAGRQITAAVRSDYEQRLQNEIRLVAQGIIQTLASNGGNVAELEDASFLKDFEDQTGGKLTFYAFGDSGSQGQPPANNGDSGSNYNSGDGDHDGPPRSSFYGMPEMETAIRGETVVVERTDDKGVVTLYTAARVESNRKPIGVIQLAVPIQTLQNLAVQRWAVLIIGFVLVSSLALIAALLLSRSIILPLYKLRESAQRLSQGDFSHRVEFNWKDEIGEVAATFNEMAGQVQSMLEEQRAFASNTSHELRTPLTAIRLRTEALRHDETLDQATARQYIEEIDDEITHLGNLVQDLTLLSRFDAGRAEVGHAQIDMVRLAHTLYRQSEVVAKEKNLKLILAAPDDPVLISGSLSHLTVLFRNLIDNAIKYTPEGGTVTWTIKVIPTGVFHTITDTGQGISEQALPHIYERFYRADKARSRDIPGTGLGLALVKSIVDAYGGTITIESGGAGKGTTAIVFWPTNLER